MTSDITPLSREWYAELDKQSNSTFINLPVLFQLRGYTYDFIAKEYLSYFKSDDNTRQDKLALAKKFLKFIQSINKNRAREEVGEEFYLCFEYFMDNFSDLVAKNDLIGLESLGVISEAIDRSKFVSDIISIEELQRRIKNLEVTKKQEEVIEAEWEEFESEYKLLNENVSINRDEYVLTEERRLVNAD